MHTNKFNYIYITYHQFIYYNCILDFEEQCDKISYIQYNYIDLQCCVCILCLYTVYYTVCILYT